MKPHPRPREAPGDVVRPRAGRTVALATAVIALGLVAFYWAMVADGQEPVAADTFTAQAHATWIESELARSGKVPAWYPDIFLGMPAYGSFIYARGNPMSFVHRALRLNRGQKYCLWLVIGGAGMAALLLRCGASGMSAFLGAFALVFTPYILGSVNAGHSSKLLTLSFMPVAFLAVSELLRRGGLFGIGASAWAVALVAWGNHPQLAYYFCLILGPYVVVWLWREGSGVRMQRVLALGAVAVLVLLMISAPFLPAATYAPESTRGSVSAIPGEAAGGTQSWEYATAWSFAPKELVSFAFPSFFGLQGREYWGPLPFTQSTHAPGVVVLTFAIVGFGALASWRRAFLLAALMAFVLIGFGRHLPVLFRPMYEILPGFDKFRVPSMAYAMLPLLLIPAMAIGLDRVADRRESRWIRRAIVGGILFFGATLLVGLVGQGGSTGADVSSSWFQSAAERAAGGAPAALRSVRREMLFDDLLRASALALLALVFAWLRLRGRAPRAVFWAAVTVAIALDLFVIDRAFYAPAPRAAAQESVRVPRPIVDPIRASGDAVRVLPIELHQRGVELWQSNYFGLDGIQSVGGYHAAGLRRVKDFILVGAWRNPALWPALDADWVAVRAAGVRLREEDRVAIASNLGGLELAVRHEDARGEWLLFRQDVNLGRAFLVPEARVIDDDFARLRHIASPGVEPAREVVLETEISSPAERTGSEWSGEARVESWDDGRVTVRVSGDGGFAVLSEAHHPGWGATVDGSEVGVLAANHIMNAVPVGPGSHEIVFEFHDRTVEVSGIASTGGKTVALLLLAAGVVSRRRGRV